MRKKSEGTTINYPNLQSFMKRHDITIGTLAKVVGKSYPPVHQKINRKIAPSGKTALFDIEEAMKIIKFIIQMEQNYLKTKFGDQWEKEWANRWGHISNWFNYIFFDEVVANVTKDASNY